MKKETANRRVRRDFQTSHYSVSSCYWTNCGTCLASAWKSLRSPMINMPYWVHGILIRNQFFLCCMWFILDMSLEEYVPLIMLSFPSSSACCGGLLPRPCHRAGEQTTCAGHPGEPAFSHQRRASTAVASTPYTCHTLIPRPILFQGTILHAHLFKLATRHPEVPPLCRWGWKI